MLNLSQMQTMLGQLQALDLDNMVGETVGASDQTAQLNWAHRIIARKCFLITETSLALTAGQNLYNFRDDTTPVVGAKIIRPYYVMIEAPAGTVLPLRAANGSRGLWTYDELERNYPAWRSASQNPPTKAVMRDHTNLLLYPTPDAATAANSGHSLFGTYLPNDLVNGNDVPLIPEEIHECVPHLAAVLSSTPVATEDEAWKRISAYNSYWAPLIEEIAEQNLATLQSWGTTSAFSENDLMVI